VRAFFFSDYRDRRTFRWLFLLFFERASPAPGQIDNDPLVKQLEMRYERFVIELLVSFAEKVSIRSLVFGFLRAVTLYLASGFLPFGRLLVQSVFPFFLRCERQCC